MAPFRAQEPVFAEFVQEEIIVVGDTFFGCSSGLGQSIPVRTTADGRGVATKIDLSEASADDSAEYRPVLMLVGVDNGARLDHRFLNPLNGFVSHVWSGGGFGVGADSPGSVRAAVYPVFSRSPVPDTGNAVAEGGDPDSMLGMAVVWAAVAAARWTPSRCHAMSQMSSGLQNGLANPQ